MPPALCNFVLFLTAVKLWSASVFVASWNVETAGLFTNSPAASRLEGLPVWGSLVRSKSPVMTLVRKWPVRMSISRHAGTEAIKSARIK